jgi:superfamily II DNA or RNA helicase
VPASDLISNSNFHWDRLWAQIGRRSWMWFFQRIDLDRALRHPADGHMRLTSAIVTGMDEIEIGAEVGKNEDNYDEPRLRLKLTANGDIQVTSTCSCLGQRALCEHAAVMMVVLSKPEAQHLTRIIAATGVPKAATSTETEAHVLALPNDELRPQLRLRRITLQRPQFQPGRATMGQVSLSLTVAEPCVSYPGCPDRFQMLGRGTGSRWQSPEGIIHSLSRNLRMERLLIADLMQCGLRPAQEILSDAQATETLRPLMTVAEADQAMFWATFVESYVPQLRQEGWEVEISPDFGHNIHLANDEAWYAELKSDADLAGESFHLDLGIEIDGHRVSLVPILVNCIDQGLTREVLNQNMDQRYLLALPPPSHDVISVPARRLEAMLGFLDELLSNRAARSKQGGLKLDKLRAAQLSTLDGLPIQAPTQLKALRERLSAFRELELVQPPHGLRADLRPYQREGLSWLQFLREFSLNGILADDMGLGKTLQTLSHLLMEKEAGRLDRPALILAPTSVIRNWAREAAKFTPDLSVLLLYGDDRHADFHRIRRHQLVITSYPLLVRDADHICRQDWHIVVLDEAQNIKNPRSKAAQVCSSLKARHRLCLTGTPIENHLGELWSLYHFLMPSLLGDADTFRSYYRNPIEKEANTDRQKQLAERLQPLLLRRTKDAVARDLPPKTEILHTIELEKEQIDLYETIRAAMDQRVREAICQQGLERSQIIVLDALLKLRQVCCHPQLLKIDTARAIKTSAKTAYLMQEILPELVEEGRKILIFSQFTEMLKLLEKELQQAGITFVKLTGETQDRETPIQQFQAGKAPVFLISLKAGGSGLNLTTADTVIHYDPWWNPAAEAQASDRAHRIGQTKPVFIHKLICRSTIEERILEMQKTKSALVESLMAGRTGKLSLTQEDIQKLLTS